MENQKNENSDQIETQEESQNLINISNSFEKADVNNPSSLETEINKDECKFFLKY